MRIRNPRIFRCIFFAGAVVLVYLVIGHLLLLSGRQSQTLPLSQLWDKVNTQDRIWEDEKLIGEDAKRVGPGEQGHPVQLTEREQKEAPTYFSPNGFNRYVSDKIALDRSLPDIRHPKCKWMRYLRKLPSVSVIMPFLEENFSTLLRTVTSIVNRSPKPLLKEVILVDDASEMRPELKGQLDEYLMRNFPSGLVRVIRNSKREGLMRARIIGAKQATGDVLVFLDSHCEVTPNWLPPLLDPIARDYRTVTCPMIDAIDAATFAYGARGGGDRGAFTWEMYYVRLPRLPKDEAYPERPFESLIMAGGLFAISQKWFWEMGAYDNQLDYWGGEQFEISFKIWMCGGRLIDVPCSRVGHIFRTQGTNFKVVAPGVDYVSRNYKRVIEVWMDEYKEYVYNRRPHYRNVDAGNLTEQLAIRKRLNCKPFKWFVSEIAQDVAQKYPLIDPPPVAAGDIRPLADPTLCIDASDPSRLWLRKCVRDMSGATGVQNFNLTFHDEIRPVGMTSCVDLPHAASGAIVNLFWCFGGHGNQHWGIISVAGNHNNSVQIQHVPTNNCLESDVKQSTLFVNPCDSTSKAQRWIWQKVQLNTPK